MSLRATIPNEIIKDLIGYDPDRLCSETIRRAKTKWNDRLGIKNLVEVKKPEYRRKTSSLLITWNILWCYNLLFSKCKQHNTLNTPNHIKNSHGGKYIPNLSEILQEGFMMHKKIRHRIKKRKGRFLKTIEKKDKLSRIHS